MRGLLLLPLLALVGCAGPQLVERIYRHDGSIRSGAMEYGGGILRVGGIFVSDEDAYAKAKVLCRAHRVNAKVSEVDVDSYRETDIEGRSKDHIVRAHRLDFDCLD